MLRFESNQLRCFVAVAEELHFGRAARRLNMTQPPLSRQIQMLEKQFGCELFVRTSRSVTLTSAGESLYTDAIRILRLMESAAASVRNVSNGSQGNIRCGFTAASAYRFMPALLRRIGEAIPGASITLKEMVSGRQIESLKGAELDLGLLRPPIDNSEFESLLVAQDPMIVALPASHPLTAKSIIEWEDLDGVDLIMYENQESRYFYSLVSGQFTRHGVYPRYCQQVTQIHTMLSLVRAAIGPAIVPESATVFDSAEIEWRPLASSRPFTADLFFVWRKDNRNPLIDAVVALALEGSDTEASQKSPSRASRRK